MAAGAMSYAELGTVVNKSGGEFSFYQCAFADMHKFWGPLPSFIYSWVSIMYVRPAEVAIIILTFAEYTIRPISLWASMTSDDEYFLKKSVSVLALGKCVRPRAYGNNNAIGFFVLGSFNRFLFF